MLSGFGILAVVVFNSGADVVGGYLRLEVGLMLYAMASRIAELNVRMNVRTQ